MNWLAMLIMGPVFHTRLGPDSITILVIPGTHATPARLSYESGQICELSLVVHFEMWLSPPLHEMPLKMGKNCVRSVSCRWRAWSANPKPSCLQSTWASFRPNPSPHSNCHWLFTRISMRPSWSLSPIKRSWMSSSKEDYNTNTQIEQVSIDHLYTYQRLFVTGIVIRRLGIDIASWWWATLCFLVHSSFAYNTCCFILATIVFVPSREDTVLDCAFESSAEEIIHPYEF